MRIHHLIIERLRDERGIALPMSLMALLILSTLVIAFALLASSEPLVATNQKMVAQARSVAESGLERAIWALNNPTDPSGIPDPLPGTVPTPYDGSAGIPIIVNGTQIGLAFVTVSNGVNPNERNLVAQAFPFGRIVQPLLILEPCRGVWRELAGASARGFRVAFHDWQKFVERDFL